MPTDLEKALAEGGQLIETEYDRALKEGGQPVDSGSTEYPGIYRPLSFVNRSLANTLGAPADLIREGLNKFAGTNIDPSQFGSDAIANYWRSKNIATANRPPETPLEYAGSGVGEVAGALLPATKAIQGLSKGTSMAGKVAKSINDATVRNPYLAGAAEVTGGAGAGTGRFVKEEVAPEGSVTGAVAEVAGGFAGGLAPVTAMKFLPARLGGKSVMTLLRRTATVFGEEGSRYRAGAFAKKQVADPNRAADVVIEETISELPPAVRSGEKRLIDVYNQLRQVDPVTNAAESEKLYRAAYQLEQELRALGYSAPEVLKNIAEQRVAAIEARMATRVSDAMKRAQDKIDALPVASRKSQESVIVRNELDKTMREAQVKVNSEWAKVNKGIDVDYSDSKQAYADLIEGLSRAERKDIPSELSGSFLAKKKPPKFPVNIKEMQGLRSKLLEVQRQARANGEWNKARISGDMADAILQDMSAVDDGQLQAAIGATRKFKERFEQGIVGRILGTQKTSAPSIPPEITLDISIGRSGARGPVDFDKVVVTPEAKNAAKRYITRSFADFTTNNGTKPFNPDKALKWIDSNREILDRFPELRSQLTDTASAQQLANNTMAIKTQRMKRIQDPKISQTARFLRSDPGKEIDAVFKSHNPVESTEHLVRLARKDPSGQAMDGLKGAYIDHIIQKSAIGPYNEVGEQTLSGRRILNFVNENRQALRRVLSPEEISRLDMVGRELAKIDMAQAKGGEVNIDFEDTITNYLGFMSRFGGATFGRWMTKWTGGGNVQVPGMFAERFKQFNKSLTQDKAFQLLHDALTADDGGELLRTLLLPLDKPGTPKFQANLQLLSQRMNLWLLGAGKRVMDDIEEEMKGETPRPNPPLAGL